MAATHDVFNQSTPFVDRNLYGIDLSLQAAVARFGADGFAAELQRLGARLGSSAVAESARLANANPPQLRNFDRSGRRIDEVEFHPAWHDVMRLLIGAGVHADPWVDPKPGAQVARAAKYVLFSQIENGAQCPVTITYAVMPVMQRYAAAVPAIARDWLPRIVSHEYDPASRPIDERRGALLGMGMTEKQGGSDVRTNTTFAQADGSGDWGARYRSPATSGSFRLLSATPTWCWRRLIAPRPPACPASSCHGGQARHAQSNSGLDHNHRYGCGSDDQEFKRGALGVQCRSDPFVRRH